MSVSVEKLEHNMAKLTIEVSEEDFDKAVEKAYQKNKNKINISGFRKGKAPRKIIEKMYGKEVFFEDAANIIIPDEYAKAYDECGEEIVSQPVVDVVQIEAGKPFIFTAEVALKPDVKLGEYKGIQIEKLDATVTDEDVEKEIDKARDAQSRQVSVDREVKDGDLTVIDFEGFVDGTPFEGGKGENYNLTIGSKAFVPGFEEQLIGKKAGDECDVVVTFPEDYHSEDLAGKEATFKCKIHEVKEKQLPELDEDFADDAGFDSVDEYKADVRKKLEEKKAADVKNAKEDAVIEGIIEKAEMDIPEAMIETSERQMVDEFAGQLQMQGLSLEQYFMFTGMTRESMMEQTKPRAEKRIKARLVMEAVAKAEGIEASEEDVNKQLEEMAKTYNMELDKVKEIIPASEIEEMKKDIAIQKAIEFAVENAKEK